MKDIKVVLPGGAGLVGQNLILRLKESGCRDIVVLDKHQANINLLKEIHPDIKVHCVDLADCDGWDSCFLNADVIVMLQAQIGDLRSEPFIRNNVVSTQNVLNAARKYQVPYIVHVSSSVVNSNADDLYIKTKKEQEQLVDGCGIDHVILRPTLMFGWFDRKHLGWLSRFLKRYPIFPVPGNGRYMRQPLFVRDFCDIILSCIKSRIRSKTFDITGLERVDYIDIISEMKAILKSRALILRIPYSVFYLLLKSWALFDKNPPFTTDQLKALVTKDEFDVIDWPGIFGVEPTAFSEALAITFNDKKFSSIVLKF